MSKQPLTISEEAKVQMPMKTVASLITLVAIGTWAFFGIQEKLNQHSTQLQIMEKDLVEMTQSSESNGLGDLLGSLPADSEQFMLIEELYKQTDKQQTRIDGMLHNEVNIQALEKAVEKLQKDVERLKDKQREFGNGVLTNGRSNYMRSTLSLYEWRVSRAYIPKIDGRLPQSEEDRDAYDRARAHSI